MSRAHGNSSRRYTDAQKAEQLKRCWDMRVAGHSELAISEATGLSPATTHRRLVEAFEAYVSPARNEIRAWEDARLDRMLRVATEIAETADDEEIRLKAIDRVAKLSERRAAMHGANAPAASLVVNADMPYDPATEYGRAMAEELAAARAEYGLPKGGDDAAAL